MNKDIVEIVGSTMVLGFMFAMLYFVLHVFS